MSNRLHRFFSLAVMGSLILVLSSGNVRAAIINPNPFIFADDDGAELFTPNDVVLNLEVYDLGSLLGYSTTFGFFYESDPGNLITIFGSEDQDPDPGGAHSIPQGAAIDFIAGLVYDVDASLIQSTFTNLGTNIGFYLEIQTDPSTAFTFYTVSALNTGGLDSAATFPLLASPDVYLIGFEEPNSQALLAFDIVGGISPAAVPEPVTLLLLGSGILGLAGYRKIRNRG